jgi:hypothetical protein
MRIFSKASRTEVDVPVICRPTAGPISRDTPAQT